MFYNVLLFLHSLFIFFYVYIGLPVSIGFLANQLLRINFPSQDKITFWNYSFFLGLIIIISICYLAESLLPALGISNYLFWFFAALSLIVIFFKVKKNLWRCNIRWILSSIKETNYVVIIACILIVSIYFQFFIFYKHPHFNYYSQVHFFKMAQEIYKWGVFNPGTASSYVPVEPFFLGWASLLLLVESYVYYPYCIMMIAATLSFTIFFQFYSVFFSERKKVVMAVILSAFCWYKLYANSELLLLLCIFLISIFLQKNKQIKRRFIKKTLLFYAVLPVVAYFIYRLLDYTAIWKFLPLVVLSLLALASFRYLKLPYVSWIILIAASCVGFHRSFIMYIPLVCFIAVLHAILLHWNAHKYNFLIKNVSLMMLLLSFVVIVLVSLTFFGFIDINLDHYQKIFVKLFLFVVGKKATNVTDLSGSMYNQVMEFVRLSPVSILALISLLIFSWPRKKILHPNTLLSLLLISFTSLFILLGIPYSYRGQFIVNLFLPVFFLQISSSKANVYISSTFLFLATVSYFVTFLIKLSDALYLQFAKESFVVLMMAIVIMYLCAIKKKKWSYALVFIFVCGFFEKTILIFYFYKVSFSPLNFDQQITHLADYDLEVAKQINSKIQAGDVIVSDPVTISNAKLLTGANALVSIENIANLSQGDLTKLKGWVDGLYRGLCLNKEVDVKLSSDTFEIDFYQKNVKNYSPNVFIVINTRTYNWLHGEDTYFPPKRREVPGCSDSELYSDGTLVTYVNSFDITSKDQFKKMKVSAK